MNIDYLREFATFSRYMSFSAASKKLYVSQPALSSHIKALERDLGVQLVDRRLMKLTNAGRALVNESSELLGLHDGIVEKVKLAPDENLEFTVALETPHTAAASNWGIFRQSFVLDNPLINCKSVEACHSTASEILESGDIDCVVVYGCMPRADVEAGVSFARIPNYTDGRLCLWMCERHPLASLSELSWSDLSGIKHPFAASIFRLWATSIAEIFEVHGVEYESRFIAGDGNNHLADMREDEVQLYDSGYDRGSSAVYRPGWLFKPIADDDAESLTFMAYREDRKSLALAKALDYLVRIDGERA